MRSVLIRVALSNRGDQRGRALKDAGLSIRFHDLRHTCITKLAEGQASEQTLMSIAGHVSRKMIEGHLRSVVVYVWAETLKQPV